ncbi:MAG: hypothetical protein M1816_002356 [Peltula sp. TS41687]|nr:MAG: hypothetical protein M1816_002356 [Peltula sp. TS41687]
MLFLRQLPYLALVCAGCEAASPNGRLPKLRRRAYQYTNSSTTAEVQSTSSVSSSPTTDDATTYGAPQTSSFSESSFPSSGSDITSPPSIPTPPPLPSLQDCYKTCDRGGCYDVCDGGELVSDEGAQVPQLNTTEPRTYPSQTNSSDFSGVSNLTSFERPPACTSTSYYNTIEEGDIRTSDCSGSTTYSGYDYEYTPTFVVYETSTVTVTGANATYPTPLVNNSLPVCREAFVVETSETYPEYCTTTEKADLTPFLLLTTEPGETSTTEAQTFTAAFGSFVMDSRRRSTVTITKYSVTTIPSDTDSTPIFNPFNFHMLPIIPTDPIQNTDPSLNVQGVPSGPAETPSPGTGDAKPADPVPPGPIDQGRQGPVQPTSEESGQGQGSTAGNTPPQPQGNGQAASGGNGQASTGGDGQASSGGSGQASPGGNGQASSGGNGQASSGGNGQASSGGNQQASSGGSGQVSSGGSGQSSSGGDGQASSGGNGQASSGGTGQASPGGNGQASSGGNGQASSGGNEQASSGGGGQVSSGGNGQASSGGNEQASSGGGGQASSGGNGQASSGGNGQASSGGNGQASSGGSGQASPGGNGQASSGGNEQASSGGGGQASSGGNGQASSGGNGQASSGGNGQASSGETGQASPGGNGQASSGGNGQASSGGAGQASSGGNLQNPGGSASGSPGNQGPAAGGSTDSTSMMINNVPLVLNPSAVVVGSQTVRLGSAPTDVVANGETYHVDSSQITGPRITLGLAPPPYVAPAGGNPAPTAVTAEGVAFSLGPSQAIFEGTTYDVGSGATPTTAVVNGRTIEIGPQGVRFDSTTIPIPPAAAAAAAAPTFSSVTAAGLTFGVNPTEAVIEGSTYHIGGGAAPTTAIINGQTVSLGPGGVGLGSTTVAAPPGGGANAGPVFSSVTAAGLTFGVNPTEAVIEGSTYQIGVGAAPTTAVINGQTISLGPGGVGLQSTTVAVPSGGGANAPPVLTAITAQDLTFSLNPTEAVISGTTYSIGAAATTPTTAIINGQTVSLGPEGISFGSTTIAVPRPTFSPVTAGGLTFSVNPTEAVISGTTYSIGVGAMPTTTVINGQTVSLGPDGIGLATTTVPVPRATDSTEQTSSIITVGDLTITVEPTEAIISGTTYAIGDGATPTTTVINGQTVTLGPGGVGLPSTTIPPLPKATGVQPYEGGAVRASARKESLIGLLLAAGVGAVILL